MTQEERLEFEEVVREYVDAVLQQKKFKEKADLLKEKVVNGMKLLGENKFPIDDHFVQLTNKSEIKFHGTFDCLSFLKNDLDGQYVIESVDEKALKEAIKKDVSFAKFLEPIYDRVDSCSLSVKDN